ncbi:MAG: wax ester/triacylglycerol synthase family O-acyltransferase [Solirubrobacterales bacterium]|nr:wax ester/triacylglycerol synthase family O-acyltransferase [Solirubrobacterales bacterium]
MEATNDSLDRLTGIDASFLSNENENSHMHIGAVMIFEGPPPSYEDFVAHVESRLPFVPRYRQKLVYPPLDAGRPLWADDTGFSLSFHMRHTALPSPGTESELIALANRVFSQSLDRTKPLWEMWLVQELQDDRFAVLIKSHHAMIDGISGVDIGTVLFDVTANPEPASPTEEWHPRPEPSSLNLLRRSAGDLATTPLRLSDRLLGAVRNPQSVIDRFGDQAEGVSEIARAFADPAPDVPLNTDIGPHRRIALAQADFADFRRIKNAFGTTVNDVVLAAVTGSVRNWLIQRGVETEGLELRALVPVSVRTADEHGQLGNKLATMRAPLPVYEPDPVAQLEIVSAAMDGLKQSKQALGAETIARLNDFAPPTLLAQAARINFSTRLFNLIVTNVPGPQMPLYVLGNKLQETFPVAFLPKNHALAIGVMSYNGQLNFGLLGDYDAMPDIKLISDGLGKALDELLKAS